MGGRRKYSLDQSTALKQIEDAKMARVTARATLRERIETAYRTQLTAYEADLSRAMNKGLRFGIAKSDVQRASGIANWDNLNKMLALTADQFQSEELDPIANWQGARWDFKASRESGWVSIQSWYEWDKPLRIVLGRGGGRWIPQLISPFPYGATGPDVDLFNGFVGYVQSISDWARRWAEFEDAVADSV